MTMEPSGTGRMVISLAVLALLALAVGLTMEPGKWQYFTWVVLGFFAFRVVLLWLRARYSESGARESADRKADVAQW